MEDFWKKVVSNKENIRFIQARSFSPYSEFSKNWYNEKDGLIEFTLNGLYRYDSIFEPLFKYDRLDNKFKDWIFDVYMHYLTELQYRNGLTVREAKIQVIKKDLKNGSYGDDVATAYKNLCDDDKYLLAHYMYLQGKTEASIYLFCKVLTDIMHNGVIYKDKENDKVMLFYINEQKKESAELKINMLIQLFMPLGYGLRVFWEKHFAMVGLEQTMQIGEIEIM